MLLWKIGENYPKIIIKYSSLISPMRPICTCIHFCTWWSRNSFIYRLLLNCLFAHYLFSELEQMSRDTLAIQSVKHLWWPFNKNKKVVDEHNKTYVCDFYNVCSLFKQGTLFNMHFFSFFFCSRFFYKTGQVIASEKRQYQVNIFLIYPRKLMLWLLLISNPLSPF